MEALWGSDAEQFKPSRWLEGNPCKGKALGPYAHLLASINRLLFHVLKRISFLA
jgi:hypothetical protein